MRGIESSAGEEVLWRRWCANAERNPSGDAIVHWRAGHSPHRWRWMELLARAETCARNLAHHGVRRGQVCALMLRHHADFYPLYLGVVRLGGIPAVLAYPNARLHPDKFRQGIEGMSQRSGLDWILTERELAVALEPCVNRAGSTIRGILFPHEWESCLEAAPAPEMTFAGEEPVLLQHSSGTTGLQKPVLLSNRAVAAHVDRYSRAIALRPDDKVVSWLPLYHDMGLIAAFHLPLAFGIPSIQLSPFEWVAVPAMLLEAISKEGGTLCWLPNFALNLMAEKIRPESLEGISLESLRLIVNCSEPVRPESHGRFRRRFDAHGLSGTALATCYAMAETTFAASQSRPGLEPRVFRARRSSLASGLAVEAGPGDDFRECLSSGTPIEGCEIAVLAPDGRALPDRQVGELAIRSVSLFEGYRNYPEKTAEAVRDGWYLSGDLGFRSEGEIYVIGRKKDVIIVAGNNVFPEDIEDEVSKVAGVIPGRVVAFAEDDAALGSERVAVLAETELTAQAERKRLRLEIMKAGMRVDATIRSVYLAPPRWLIKSSAGKPSRRANSERVRDGELPGGADG